MNSSVSNLLKILNGQRKNDLFCDLQIIAKNYERVSVHTCILATVSDVLQLKLRAIWKQNQATVIPLQMYMMEYPAPVISHMLDIIYCFSSEILKRSSEIHSKDLMKLANEWQCTFLLDDKGSVCPVNQTDKCRHLMSAADSLPALPSPLLDKPLSVKDVSTGEDSVLVSPSCQPAFTKELDINDASEELLNAWKSCRYCAKYKGKRKGSLTFHMSCCMVASLWCEGCHHPFINDQEQLRHSCKKKPRSHICELCGKVLSSKDGLSLHRQVHDGVKTKSCNICEKKFQRSCQLKCHMMRVHNKERPFTCGMCSVTFAFQFDLKKHIKTMHEGNTSCTEPLHKSTLNVQEESLQVFNGRKLLPKLPVVKDEEPNKESTESSLSAAPNELEKHPSPNTHIHLLDLNKLVYSHLHSKESISERTESPVYASPPLSYEDPVHSNQNQLLANAMIYQPPSLYVPSHPLSLTSHHDTDLPIPRLHHEDTDCQSVEESLAASSILVSQFLDQHALAANLPHDLSEDNEDITESVTNALSFTSANFPLSHTFGSFDNAMNIGNSSGLDEHVIITSESGTSLYQAIL